MMLPIAVRLMGHWRHAVRGCETPGALGIVYLFARQWHCMAHIDILSARRGYHVNVAG